MEDPVDITTIKAFLVDDHGVDLSTDASVEVKRAELQKKKSQKGLQAKRNHLILGQLHQWKGHCSYA